MKNLTPERKEELRKRFHEEYCMTNPAKDIISLGFKLVGSSDYWLNLLNEELEKERQKMIGYIEALFQDEHPVDCVDGVTPVETYGYEETHNNALKQVIKILQDSLDTKESINKENV